MASRPQPQQSNNLPAQQQHASQPPAQYAPQPKQPGMFANVSHHDCNSFFIRALLVWEMDVAEASEASRGIQLEKKTKRMGSLGWNELAMISTFSALASSFYLFDFKCQEWKDGVRPNDCTMTLRT